MNFYKNSVSAGSVFLVAILLTLQACSPNNVTIQDDYKKYFDETATTGSFGLFDNGSGEFYIYNLAQFKDSSYAPASTFEIVNALVGIETGRIVDEKMILSVDSAGPIRMDSAFKQTSKPYFMEVARRIGKDTMQHWLDSLQYGTKNMGSAVDSFWYDNKLVITPDEQMGLVKKLYFGQLPFQKRSQEMVKMLMLQTANTNYKLSYKQGVSFKQNGKAVAWIVGWIEENKHPYFFVLQTESAADTDLKTVSMTVLNKILKSQGFFEGKR